MLSLMECKPFETKEGIRWERSSIVIAKSFEHLKGSGKSFYSKMWIWALCWVEAEIPRKEERRILHLVMSYCGWMNERENG